MFERLTDRARRTMAMANHEAQRFNHEYIGTEHILLGLLKEGSGIGAHVLLSLGLDLKKLRLDVERVMESGPPMVVLGKLPQTPRAKKVIEYAIEEARNFNHRHVGTEHLLLGLLREEEGVAWRVLSAAGVGLKEARTHTLELLEKSPDEDRIPDAAAVGAEKSARISTDIGLPRGEMLERLTDRARKVFALANQEAHALGHQYIGTEHVLLGVIREGGGVGATVLKELGLDLDLVQKEILGFVKKGVQDPLAGKLPQTPATKKVIEHAIKEAKELKHNYVGTDHLLLGLIRESDGVAAQVLSKLGVQPDSLRERIVELVGALQEIGEPYRLPTLLTAVPVPYRPNLGMLVDDQRIPVCGSMPLELAQEIARRYNAAQS